MDIVLEIILRSNGYDYINSYIKVLDPKHGLGDRLKEILDILYLNSNEYTFYIFCMKFIESTEYFSYLLDKYKMTNKIK